MCLATLQRGGHVMKVVFVGDSGTGKTSLLKKYVDNDFCIKYEETVRLDH